MAFEIISFDRIWILRKSKKETKNLHFKWNQFWYKYHRMVSSYQLANNNKKIHRYPLNLHPRAASIEGIEKKS